MQDSKLFTQSPMADIQLPRSTRRDDLLHFRYILHGRCKVMASILGYQDVVLDSAESQKVRGPPG